MKPFIISFYNYHCVFRAFILILASITNSFHCLFFSFITGRCSLTDSICYRWKRTSCHWLLRTHSRSQSPQGNPPGSQRPPSSWWWGQLRIRCSRRFSSHCSRPFSSSCPISRSSSRPFSSSCSRPFSSSCSRPFSSNSGPSAAVVVTAC